jgi:threonine dehydrogenase-like Zn-dependent dehydrogenase
MKQHMRIWQWMGGNRIEQALSPVPTPGPHEVLLRVRAIGICGTDLHIMRGILPLAKPPIALGHEVAGDVVACGPGVTQVKSGDRCCVDPGFSCGYCTSCRTGQKTYCSQAKQLGMDIAGAWQEYLVVPEINCYQLPERVSYLAASQAEPLFTVVGGIDKLQLKMGEPVLVIGGGPAGLLFAYLAQQLSCVPAVLAGTRPRRLEIARRWAIGKVIDVSDQPLEAALAGAQFPVVIEAAGRPQSIQQALAFCAPGGRVLAYGLPGESIPIDLARLVIRDSSLLGTNDRPASWPRVINMIAGGMVPLQDLVTQVYPFSRLPDAVAWHTEHADETIKVAVDVGE